MTSRTGTMERVGGDAGLAPRPGLLFLCSKDPDRAPRVVPFRAASVVVGREPPKGGVRLPETAVSREHARFFREGDGCFVEDLRSRNGTYVDGRRVTRERLRDRAVVRIGDTLFSFLDDGIDDHLGYELDRGTLAAAPSPVPELVGGHAMHEVARAVERAAKTDLSVLALGETGTGKEVVARAVHRLSGRKGAFVAVNCAAVPTSLFESELFGVKRGAFSGADRDKPGILFSAAGGTVFLDEIGDMPMEAQAKLLRAIEAREVTPLGAVKPERIDARFVSATNQDLAALVDEGRFRADLFARVSGFTIALPPLRERKEDLGALVDHFLAVEGRGDLAPSFGFLLGLCDHDFPRNVRECQAIVRRAVATADGPTLEARHLPPELRARVETYGARSEPAPSMPPPSRGALPEPELVKRLLATHEGNVAAVARELGKDRAQVHRLIRRYELDADDFRDRRG